MKRVSRRVTTTMRLDSAAPLIADRHEAFAREVAATRGELGRFAYLLVGNSAAADDLLAEAYARAWPHYRRGNIDNVAGYLRRSMANLAKGRLRRLRLERREVATRRLDWRVPRASAPESGFEHRVESQDELWRAIWQLPVDQRAVIILRHAEDRSEEETAALLGVSVGTVKSRSSRGLATLRTRLGRRQPPRPRRAAMNERLEDLIRRSAHEQARRYRPGSDLEARVEHRRRQRAARRMTAAGVAMAAVVGVIGFAATRDTGRSDLEVAAPSTSIGASTDDGTGASEHGADGARALRRARRRPPRRRSTRRRPRRIPAAMERFGRTASSGTFHSSGTRVQCAARAAAADGGIGDVIPDGLFAGFVTGHDASNVSIDLLCIFAVPDRLGAAERPGDGHRRPPQLRDRQQQHTIANDADGRSDRRAARRSRRCRRAVSTEHRPPSGARSPPDRQVWVRIHEGRMTWVFAECRSVLADQRPANVAAT